MFTGLHHGEKLDETLWEEGALVSPTEHPDILVVTESDVIDSDRLKEVVDRLIDAGARHDRSRILRVLRDYIPTATWTPARDPSDSSRDSKILRPASRWDGVM